MVEHMMTRMRNFSSFSMKACCAGPHLNFLIEGAQMRRSQNLFNQVSDQHHMLTYKSFCKFVNQIVNSPYRTGAYTSRREHTRLEISWVT